MSTPRNIGAAIAASSAAVAGQAAAKAATINAAAIAALSEGVTTPAPIPAVTGPPGASDGQGGG